MPNEKEITFSDSEDPTICQMTGQVVTTMELSESDLAFLKQVFDILLKITKLWLQHNRNRKQMTNALDKFQSMLLTEPGVQCTVMVYNSQFFRKFWHCTECNFAVKDFNNYCPNCGRKISNSKEI